MCKYLSFEKFLSGRDGVPFCVTDIFEKKSKSSTKNETRWLEAEEKRQKWSPNLGLRQPALNG